MLARKAKKGVEKEGLGDRYKKFEEKIDNFISRHFKWVIIAAIALVVGNGINIIFWVTR